MTKEVQEAKDRDDVEKIFMQLGESAVDDLNLFRLLKYQDPLPQIDPEKRKEDK
jgi:hypothetical protein